MVKEYKIKAISADKTLKVEIKKFKKLYKTALKSTDVKKKIKALDQSRKV